MRWSIRSGTASRDGESSITSPASGSSSRSATACSSSPGRGSGKIDLRDYLDLVAIGTVADIVPLVEENRVLVRRGLRQLEHTLWPGLRALIEVSQVSFPVTAQDVGFRLGPRLNASGRLGDAMLSLRLLQTDDRAEAVSIASELNRNNRERQAVEMETFLQAEAQLQETYDPARDWGIVLSGRNWHWGVIGIVASRLQKRYHRPTIVIGLNDEGMGKGSGRSIDGISIVKALQDCAELLELFGGHDMAAGLNIRAERVDAFREAFNRHVRAQAGDDVFQSTLALSGAISLAGSERPAFPQVRGTRAVWPDESRTGFSFRGDYLYAPRAAFSGRTT